MIFDLVQDFVDVLGYMPRKHPRFRILDRLCEAMRRDVQFIHRHREDYSQALFQTLWNTGWWYDSPQAAGHYVLPQGADKLPLPWATEGTCLCELLTTWQLQREETTPGFPWFRALRPPVIASDSGLLATFKFERGIAAIAFCRDNTRMVSATRFAIHLTNLSTGEDCVIPTRTSRRIECIALSPDGSTIAAGFDNGTVGVCQAGAGSEIRFFERHAHKVRCVVFSPCGNRIATSAAFEGVIKVWQIGSEVDCVIDCGGATTLSFSVDGHCVAFGTNKGVVGQWSYETDDDPVLCEEHETQLDHVAFSLDGLQLGSVSLEGKICIRNLHTGELTRKSLTDMDEFRRFRLSPGLGQVVCGSWQGVVRLVDLASGDDLFASSGHDDEVSAIAFLSDGQSLASASWDKAIHLWKVAKSGCLFPLKGSEFKKTRLAFSPDESLLACLGDDRDAPGTGQGNAILIFDAARGTLEYVLKSDHQLSAVAISHHNRLVAAGTLDDSILIWDLCSRQHTFTLRAPYLARPKNVVFSSNDRLLAAETWQDFSVWIWDAVTGEPRSILRGHTKSVQNIAFSDDSRQALSGGNDQTVRIWDTATGACIQVLPQSSQVLSVTFAANGKWIACGLADGSTCIWDITSSTPRLHTPLVGHSEGVERVWFSQSSDRLMSATKLATRIWDSESGKLLRVTAYSNNELVEKRVDTGSVVAAMSAVADEVITTESGDLWAGASGFNLFLVRLDDAEARQHRETQLTDEAAGPLTGQN